MRCLPFRVAVLWSVLVLAPVAHADVRLPAIFSDHMVLQDGKPVVIWGHASPGEDVTVALPNGRAKATAKADGTWRVDLPAPPPTGAFEVVVTGTSTITLKDVVAGEVWLASGQSNMEWPLAGSRDGYRDTSAAHLPKLRLFHAARPDVIMPAPTDVIGRWARSTPEEAGPFSAVGHTFGRLLAQALDKPVGIINASWGGTPAEAWTPRDALAALPSMRGRLPAPPADPAAFRATAEAHAAARARFRAEHPTTDPGNQGFAKGWADPTFDDRAWKAMTLPSWWEAQGLGIDGVVWFRRQVLLPTALVGKELVVRLGLVNNCDTAYVQGVEIGHTCDDNHANPENWSRAYTVPAALTKTGRLTIAVRVYDKRDEGGFPGAPEDMAVQERLKSDGPLVPLAGPWLYAVEQELAPEDTRAAPPPPSPPGLPSASSPSALYDAFIAPIAPLPIRGVIWYQGESNTGRAFEYRTLFPAMIASWRQAFAQPHLPFYFVQLANYHPKFEGAGRRSDDEWAELREAQLLTLRTKNTGMVVTIDIGERSDIHPRNKQEVGRRLSLWALSQLYGKGNPETPHSGPIYRSVQKQPGALRVSFDHAQGLRTARKNERIWGFSIAGPDRVFVNALAIIDGSDVVLSAPNVPKPVAVRFGWTDDPTTNLVNAAGLPASPFRTDTWPGFTERKRPVTPPPRERPATRAPGLSVRP